LDSTRLNYKYFMKSRIAQVIFAGSLIFLLGSFSAIITPPFGIKTVVIDAGHGGKDPGCHGDEFKEKDVALAIALKLGAYIEKYMKDVKVIYTRDKDVFVELDERAAIANRNHADLFICIHCNSACSYNKKTHKEHCNNEAYGSETYVMGLNKMNANFSVAQRENSVITMEDNYKKKYEGFDPNSDEGYIAGKIAQGAVMDNSLNFAAKVQASFKEKAGRLDKGVKQAGFLVLWKTQMPSVLIETGFLTNDDDHDFLGDTKGQDNMAASIFRAFRQYKDDIEGRKGVKYDDDVENMNPYSAPKKVHIKKEEPKDPAPDDSTVKKDSIQVKKEQPLKKDSILVSDKGVVFRVQFLSSDKQVPPDSDKFKIINDVTEYSINGVFKYAAGNCRTPEEASKLQTYIRKNGYPDAFVIAFKDGKRISYNDAVKLLKE
jgi:N-acetylmuramoyl-L-alanine amidase